MVADELIIEAGQGEKLYWRDLWRYRGLFYFLTWRDVLVRYKQTLVGIGWALIRPFLTMIVFTVLFGKLAALPSGGVPYPLLVFSALLPWQFVANALSESGNSVVSNANLISKIYFPRMIVPLSAIITSLVDFGIALLFLALLLVGYQFVPSWRILMLPLFTFLAAALAVGGGLWLSALTVRYRDFRIIVPFLLQFGVYVSPVGFSSDVIPDRWRLAYSLNPMVGVIDGYRWCILGAGQKLYLPGFVLSLGLLGIILISGIRYFRQTEKSFADVI